jgi:hypothetical protein
MWDTIHDEVVPSSARLAPPNLGDPPLEPLARHTRVGADDEVTHLLSQVPPDAQHLDVVAHSYRVVQLLLVFISLVHVNVTQPRALGECVRGFREGSRRGRETAPLWALRFEELLDRPLTEVQAMVQLTRSS